jgi:hypothetical protein
MNNVNMMIAISAMAASSVASANSMQAHIEEKQAAIVTINDADVNVIDRTVTNINSIQDYVDQIQAKIGVNKSETTIARSRQSINSTQSLIERARGG